MTHEEKNKIKWNAETEQLVMQMRKDGKTYSKIGNELGFSETSVKHKVRRIQQNNNDDRYKHTTEKRKQAEKYVIGENLSILETHCGYGGMTEFYQLFGQVECYDNSQERIDHIKSQCMQDVYAIKADSESEIYRLCSYRCIYDVIDLDPYGMPSRYFPMIFSLINDGLLFVTLPMIGVAQINKITVRHLQAFWGVELSDKDCYIEKVFSRMKDYAFMHKREIQLLDCARIDRIYRLCIRVKKTSCCKIVGLTVNRKKLIEKP